MAKRPYSKRACPTRTPAAAAVLLDGLADGVPLRELCRREGMPSWRTVYDWIASDPDFAAQVTRARELGFDALAEEVLGIADDGTNDWMQRHRRNGSTEEVVNTEHILRSKLRIETRLKLLACWDPKKYGNKQTVDVGNKEGETLKVDSNAPEIAASVAAALRAGKRDQ